MFERTELNSAKNYYSSTFLQMHLHSAEDLADIAKYDKKTSALFLHEYIHFLQDITTTYGYSYISQIVDYIKYCAAAIHKTGTDEFTVPIEIIKSTDDNVFTNEILRKIYLGDTRYHDACIVEKVCLLYEDVDINGVIKKLDKYCVTLSDGPNSYEYYFGTHAICENMAFIIEDTIYPGVISKPPEIPYLLAEKIVNFIYPSLATNRLNILALCDASMLMIHPAQFFISNLYRMKATNFLPTSPNQVYDYCFLELQFNFHGMTNISELLFGNAAMAILQMQGYFTTDTFGQNKEWLLSLITKAVLIRLKFPTFIIELASSGEIQSNNYFKMIIKELGTPMITNIHHEGFILDNQSVTDYHPEFLWAIKEVLKVFRGVKKIDEECVLYKYCKRSGAEPGAKDYTGSRCSEPWTRIDDEELCIFATLWRTWGLSGKYPSV